jgi:hypothetical protein
MTIIVILVLIYLSIQGYGYYQTSIEERFFHQDHASLKPSGWVGHGLGIIGSFFIVFGVSMYMARKRWKILARAGLIKHWLEFHIFLCTLGPIMVLFHTAFKFGGIVSVSFWSMVAVVMSGVIGRFIYLQIPRTIEGRELSLHEVHDMRNRVSNEIRSGFSLEDDFLKKLDSISDEQLSSLSENGITLFIKRYIHDYKKVKKIKSFVVGAGLGKAEKNKLVKMVKNEISLNRRISRLLSMQKLFRYWHVVHLPFAIIMMVIMIIHIAVTLAFGYTWIF